MKNKEFVKETIKLVGTFTIRVIIAYVIAILFYVLVLDGFLAQRLGNGLYNLNYDFYVWVVTNKNIIVIVYLVLVFMIVAYRFFLKRVKNEYILYDSLNNILNENTENIELPTDLIKFSERINKIKYEYNTSQNNAKEAEKKKNDLMMYMAHDLKTPLTSVIGYLSLLNEANIQDKQAEQKYLKIAYDKSLRLEELTNQFFEITRYNLNDMPINKINIDLSILFNQLIDEFYPMLEERKLKLEVNKPNILIYKADGDKLARAFGNLLKNAISYSYENTTITVDVIETEKIIEIVFKNRGVTIPEYKLDKIFEQFYRADESRGTNNGGAGLGLAITKDIIELHNGTIEAKSEDETIEFIIKLNKFGGN